MLALYLTTRRDTPASRGARILPIRSWETARPQLRAWIGALNTGKLGRRRDVGPFLSLVKIPETHPICILINVKEFKIGDLAFCPLRDLLSDDREILDMWFDSTPREQFLEMVIAETLPAGSIKWTKDMRLLFGPPPNRRR